MTKTIVLGGGCFWCTEAVFQQVHGVVSVTPGYAGGDVEDPSYEQVSTGATGHAEVVEVAYDPEKVSLERLLHIFFATHNPTTLNMQGADIGTEYRSVIFYTEEEDLPVIEKVVHEVQKAIRDDIVTDVEQLDEFYEAEDYHHNYYTKNRAVPYCQMVIDPKLDKLTEYLRENPL